MPNIMSFLYADFTFIHSKFVAPLPLSMDEFVSSLQSVFPHIIDVNQMMKEINPLKKVKNISTAMSYLKNRFSAAVDMEIRSQGQLLTLVFFCTGTLYINAHTFACTDIKLHVWHLHEFVPCFTRPKEGWDLW